MNLKPWIFLLIFSLTWPAVHAQPLSSAFIHYSTDQGLSNDYITCIDKDRLGFLWVGTTNGLNRFDGHHFKIFLNSPESESSIPDNNLIAISHAPDGWLWIATTGGLCKIDPVSLHVVRIKLPANEDTIRNDVVTKVLFDSKGMAWTTCDQGIVEINPKTNKVSFFLPTALKSLGWYGMVIDAQDRLWMMKDTLRRYDTRRHVFKSFMGLDTSQVMSGVLGLTQDKDGNMWAGTWGRGMWEYSKAADEFIRRTDNTLAMMLLLDTIEGRKFFWVAGTQSGLGIYDPLKDQFIEFKPDPRDPYTHNNYLGKVMYKDPVSGDVWIGTEVGLEHYAPSTIRFGRTIIPPEKDMGQFSLVSGVVKDKTDTSGHRYFVSVWGSGLFAWDKQANQITRFRSNTNFTGGGNFNILQDRNGIVWGCMNDGVGRYDPATQTWKEYLHFFKENNRINLIWCAYEDSHGNLWFGSNKEGLYKYNPAADRMEQELFSSAYANEKGYVNIMDIAEDSLGRLWLACNVGSIVRFNPEDHEAVQLFYPGQHTKLLCNALRVARNGKVYAACYDHLLELDYNGKELRRFSQANGLKTNRIYFLQEDFQGKIWFNSAYLLHCLDPVDGSFSYYGKPDGLFSNTMTDGFSITTDGEMFVGFQNAFNFFFPDKLRKNNQPPPVAITSIKVMNKERSLITRPNQNFWSRFLPGGVGTGTTDTFLVLHPGEDFFEIEFAALNYNQQERNQYAYYLEGFNKDWVYTDRPAATFTNLDGGDYILHMKAANNDGIWNEKGALLHIRVNPSFYKTQWFPLLIGFSMLGLMAVFLLVRRHQRKRLENFREMLARDLHDEMGSTLSSIRFFSEYANQQIGQVQPHVTPVLDRISQSATNLSESMQDIIWAMKMDHDHLEDLAAHMTEFGLSLLEARNIDFKTSIHEDFKGRQIQPEVRRNLYLIYKEAINNAAKYAGASQVKLTLEMNQGRIKMIIRDDGKGFDPEETQSKGGGNGLSNMHKRAEEIGGTLKIISAPGSGTTIEINLKN